MYEWILAAITSFVIGASLGTLLGIYLRIKDNPVGVGTIVGGTWRHYISLELLSDKATIEYAVLLNETKIPLGKYCLELDSEVSSYFFWGKLITVSPMIIEAIAAAGRELNEREKDNFS